MIADNGDKHPGGRPKKFTREKQDTVISIIECGGSRKMAAKAVNVSVTTIRNEMDRNPEFLDRVREAESSCYRKHLAKIQGSRDWKASAWFLARKWPDEFSEVQKVAQVDSKGNDLTPDQRERAIQSIMETRFNGLSQNTRDAE